MQQYIPLISKIKNSKISYYFQIQLKRKALNDELSSGLTLEKVRKIINFDCNSGTDLPILIMFLLKYIFQLQLIPQFAKLAQKIKDAIGCHLIYQRFRL
jgi:hypothetical protein